MKDFKNKTAFITGAGNGIGAEIAKECATREMKIVLIDIDETCLQTILTTVKEMGAEAIAIHADVSLQTEVEKAVQAALDTYGSIDLLVNSAGVALSGKIWELPIQEWDWIVSLNIMSQVYTMRSIIPIMLKQNTECYIVNVASIAGLITTPQLSPYYTTKHANVALSESVYFDIQRETDKIHMSVYCPGFIQTDLYHYEKRRPQRFSNKSDSYYSSEAYNQSLKNAEHVITTGIPIDSVGMMVFNSIEENEFYILTHPKYNTVIKNRTEGILSGKSPNVKSWGG